MGSKLRRIVGMVIAVSVIFAGAGLGHAGISQSGGHGQHVMQASVPDSAGADHHESKASSQQDQMNCHNKTTNNTDSPVNKPGGMSGCCHSVVSPLLMCDAPWSETVDVAESQRLVPPADDDAQTHIPEGEFRPPRPWS